MTYDIMHLTASTVRSVIVAPPGKKLVVSDLSNIEGRGLAWLAGEEWKLQAYRDFDAGTGPDLYKLAYAKAFRIEPEDVTKFGRSVGKVMELGLGYAGGINAFVTFALVYGIDLEEMANTAWDTLPEHILEEATDFVRWLQDKGTRWPMSDRAAIVCESFKRMWRAAHPMTVQLWREMEDGFRSACLHPGTTFRYRGFAFRRDGAWLRIKLPSGRCLCYPQPQIGGGACKTCGGTGKALVGGFVEDGGVARWAICGECDGAGRKGNNSDLSFMGTNQFTRKWERIKTYGGRLTENATQSIARDFMFDALPGIEAAGYELTMRVHDEVITEAPDTPDYNAEHLSELLAATPPWGAGMPLAAAGFESYVYKKD